MKKIVVLIVVVLLMLNSVAFAAGIPTTLGANAQPGSAISDVLAENGEPNGAPSDSAMDEIEPRSAPLEAEELQDAPAEPVQTQQEVVDAPENELIQPFVQTKSGAELNEAWFNDAYASMKDASAEKTENELSAMGLPSDASRFVITKPIDAKTFNIGADIYTEARMLDCWPWYYSLAVFKNGKLYEVLTEDNFIKTNNMTYYGTFDTSRYAAGDYELFGIVHTEQGGDGGLVMFRHTVSFKLRAPTEIYNFADRLYTKALGRSADAAGKEYWAKSLIKGTTTGMQAAASFFISPEMENKKLSNGEYITRLYRTCMNREADSSGKSYWMGVLDQGVSRKYLITGFLNSSEFRGLCNSAGITLGTYVSDEARDKNPKATGFINRLYKTCMGRSGDANGLNFWAGKLLEKTVKGGSMAYNFFFSPEFKNKNYNGSEYIKRLYSAMMNRQSDAAGLEFWQNQIYAGKSREEVFWDFVNSSEFGSICSSYGIPRL